MTRSRRRPQRRHIATVNVYGAGVAGLTAAHELAERGFRVRVVETAEALDRRGRPRLAIGGLARTQYARVPRRRAPERELHAQVQEPGSRAAPDEPVGPRVLIEFPTASATLDELIADSLDAVIDEWSEGLADLHIRVTGCADPRSDHPPGDLRNRALARQRADTVRAALIRRCGFDPALLRIELEVADDAVPTEWQVEARELWSSYVELDEDATEDEVAAHGRWVVLEADDMILPGEHGFRFFPTYYRHVFDTMRRIPLLDALGEPSGRTVIDNIVSTRQQGGAAQGLENPVLMPRAPGGSDLSLSESFARLIDHGYDWQDLSQFFLRVLRYMATSSKRRAAELEEMSWWQFLCGWDPDTQTARFRYSERFAHDVKFSTKVLVAFNADWGDARTNGSTYIQLFLNSLVQRERVDGCLNGPTSRAWFEPWRAHLELLGVEFVQGTLATLRVDEHGRVLPYTRSARDSAPRPDLEADYYVVATDVVTAEAVTRELPQRGVPATLDGYTTRVDPNPRKATGESTTRDPHARVGVAPWDRLQTLTGIQYYFTTDFKLVHGHMYFADAPWALSSISQQQFWRDRPLLHRDGYCAVLSVDVGAFDRPATDPALGGRAAQELAQEELAHEVWRQICASLGERLDQPKDADAPRRHDVINPTLRFPQPAWFHMDEFIEYGLADESGDERPLRNHAPFLIPIAGDWKRRPGGDPWSPRAGDRELAARPEHREIWQAPHGGYWVHWNRLVFAGTYKKTFTRMTTMESANESARHAVNAILDHFLLSPAARRRRQQHLGAAAVADEPRLRLVEPELDAQSDETSGATARPWRPAAPDEAGHDAPYRSSLLGDYCQIWDIEDYELPEFKPLRRYDEELFDQGMPHPWDLAGVEVMPAVFSKMPRVEGSSFAALRALLTSVRQRLESSAKESWRSGSIEDGIELLEAIRKTVESELERTFAGFERARRRGRGDESENA